MVKRHAHHFAFAAATAALLAYGVSVYLGRGPHPEAVALERVVRQREAEMRTPKGAPPPSRAWTRDALSPWNAALGAVAAVDPWAASLRSEERGVPKTPIGPKPPVAVAPSTAFEAAEASQEGVTLRWSAREWTSKNRQALAQERKIPVELTGFKVERRSGGGWESIATLDGKARSYKDAAVEPKTTYVYRVTALSAAKDFLESGGEGGAPNPSGVAGLLLSAPVTTPDIWSLAFSSPSSGTVYVHVKKYEKALGAWVETRLIQRDGERLGWKGGSSKHVVSFAKGGRELDFDTGLTLVSVKPKKVSIEITKCEATFNPGGSKVFPCPKAKETRTFDVHEIVTESPEGRRAVLFPNPKEHPNAKDQICPDCRR